MIRFISAVFTALFVPVFFVLFEMALLLVFLSRIFGSRVRIAVTHFCYLIFSRALVWTTLSRVEVIGDGYLPEDEPYVIYSNHSSFYDIPIISGFLDHKAAYAARASLIKGLFGVWVLLGDGVLLEQKGTKQELRNILKIVGKVRTGRPFVVFPEGTRTRDGRVGALKAGSLKIASKAGAKLVPVRIEGSRDLLARGAKWPYPAQIRIIIARPVNPEEILLYPDKVQEGLSAFFQGKRETVI